MAHPTAGTKGCDDSHQASARIGTAQSISAGPRDRLGLPVPPDAAQQEEDVGQEGEDQGEKRRLARLDEGGEHQPPEDQADEEEPPGSDPVEERGPPELAIQEQEDDEQEDGPCRLDDERKEVGLHRILCTSV